MSAGRRTPRDRRRRRLGQNFTSQRLAEDLVVAAGVRPGELVVDLGAGRGALSAALLDAGARVVAVEVDPLWTRHLERLAGSNQRASRLEVVQRDALSWPLPDEEFRVVASVPFGATTGLLRHLFDDPEVALLRADLIVQWEVARKRAAVPPTTLLSAAWAPWWEFQLGRRVPAEEFRPVPAVDAGVLTVLKRTPPLLPGTMAAEYRGFLRQCWPFTKRAVPPSGQARRARGRRSLHHPR